MKGPDPDPIFILNPATGGFCPLGEGRILLKALKMRRFLGNQKGGGKLGLLLALVILFAGAYAAYVMVPIRIKTYEFLDEMRQEARFGAVNRKDDIVHQRLMKKAKRIGIPHAFNKIRQRVDSVPSAKAGSY